MVKKKENSEKYIIDVCIYGKQKQSRITPAYRCHRTLNVFLLRETTLTAKGPYAYDQWEYITKKTRYTHMWEELLPVSSKLLRVNSYVRSRKET